MFGSGFIQVLFSGLAMGAAYALVAVGFTIVSGVMRVVNFAHGHIVMVSMFCSYALYKYLGIDPYISLFLIFLVFLVLGAGLYHILIKPILAAPEAAQLLVTIGLFIILENGANALWGSDIRSISLSYSSQSLVIGDSNVALTRVIAASGSILAVICLTVFLKYTSFGTEIRAAADNRLGALLTGIPIQRVFMGAFALAVALASLAGSLLMPFYLIDPFVGNDLMLRAFVIAVIGGFGNVVGALIGGLMIGLVEAMGSLFFEGSFSNVLVFGLLIVTILFFPKGFFGGRGA